MKENSFGGSWTEIKLDCLREYIEVYTTALKNKGFWLVYIDAFAGSGEYSPAVSDKPRLGSAKIALDSNFDQYYFIDIDDQKIKSLKASIEQKK